MERWTSIRVLAQVPFGAAALQLQVHAHNLSYRESSVPQSSQSMRWLYRSVCPALLQFAACSCLMGQLFT